jgi:DNA-binding CsgD family transcriptional regulator/tetratricopeptide (TPR) repeat protein
MSDLPGPLRLTSSFPFVGRSAELGRLRALLDEAGDEGTRVALLGGEPGSGKSRLVREFAATAAADGALVLYGACDVQVRSPYGAFVEALDQLARAAGPEALRSAAGAGAGELTRLLPELAGDVPAALAGDPDTERHRLHTAVADLLAGLTSERPAVLVLEDVHWADSPTLLLLHHLARTGGARALLLATFRDTETDKPEAVTDLLADLRRYDVVRLGVAGLSEDEVAEFVRRAGGVEPDADASELAGAIRGLTDGNAFLVCELWRALVDTGAVELMDGSLLVRRSPAELASPESVREVVSRRLARLDPVTSDLLELAATAGPEFELEMLRRSAGLGEGELVAALDEAVRSGLIEELPARGLAWRFTHELVRRALYDRLSRVRRAELHLRVAEGIEAGGDRSGRALADLAHHFASASPFGGTERAVGYNVLAARSAAAALAFGEATERLQTALSLGIEDPGQRGEVLIELGEASNRGGRASDALHAFHSAAEIARELDDAELLARAATGYEDACWRPGIHDQGAVELLEEAVGALGEDDCGLRVRLLSGLARALDFQGRRDEGAVARADAIELARRLEDRPALAGVLVRAYWSRGATPLDEILAMLTEAHDIAAELGDTELRAEAMSWRVPAFVALRDLASARLEVAMVREIAEQTAQPFLVHVAEHYGSAIALCDGRLDEAELRARRSHEWARLLTGRDPSAIFGIQMFSVQREQGRLADLAPVVRVLAGEAALEGPWRPGLVALLAEIGMEDEARLELSRLVSGGLEQYRESLWLGALAYLTDAAAALGDESVAALVYPELEPLAGENVMVGHLVSCYGAADRYLGMAAATLGEWERAEEHFERALELNREMGADTWVAHTAYEYGRLLLARPVGDRSRSDALLAEAARLAERIGMPSLLARVRATGASAPRPGALPDGLSAREVQILALVAQGMSNRQVGTTLSISEHTAANHMRSILRKTGCANRTEAASYAHRHGLARA